MSKPCKDCVAEGVTTKRAAPHPGPRCSTHHRIVKAGRRKAAQDKRVLATYNMAPEQYDKLYQAQGGRCFICRRATGKRKRLSVDHDHACCKETPTCGECNRGLLCGTCNKTLGHFRDDPEAGLRLATYLTDPPAQQLARTGKVELVRVHEPPF